MPTLPDTQTTDDTPTTTGAAPALITEIVRVCYTVRMRVTADTPTEDTPPRPPLINRTLIAGQDIVPRFGLEANTHNLQSFFIFLSVAAIVTLVVSLVVFVPQVMEKYGVSFSKKSDEDRKKNAGSIEWHCAPDTSTAPTAATPPVTRATRSVPKPAPLRLTALQKILRACCCARNSNDNTKNRAIRYLVESLHKPRRTGETVRSFDRIPGEPNPNRSASPNLNTNRNASAMCTSISEHVDEISGPREVERTEEDTSQDHGDLRTGEDVVVDVDCYMMPSGEQRDEDNEFCNAQQTDMQSYIKPDHQTDIKTDHQQNDQQSDLHQTEFHQTDAQQTDPQTHHQHTYFKSRVDSQNSRSERSHTSTLDRPLDRSEYEHTPRSKRSHTSVPERHESHRSYNKQSLKAKRKLFSGTKPDRRPNDIRQDMKHRRMMLRRMKKSPSTKCIMSSDGAAAESSSLDTVADVHYHTMDTSLETVLSEERDSQDKQKGHGHLKRDKRDHRKNSGNCTDTLVEKDTQQKVHGHLRKDSRYGSKSSHLKERDTLKTSSHSTKHERDNRKTTGHLTKSGYHDEILDKKDKRKDSGYCNEALHVVERDTQKVPGHSTKERGFHNEVLEERDNLKAPHSLRKDSGYCNGVLDERDSQKATGYLTKDSGYCNEALDESSGEDNKDTNATIKSGTMPESPVKSLDTELSHGQKVECKVDIHMDTFHPDQEFWESSL